LNSEQHPALPRDLTVSPQHIKQQGL